MQTDIQIIEPFNSCVYQRNENGNAVIPVVGKITAGISSVVATFNPLVGGTKVTETISVDSSGNFSKNVSVPAGWYSLTISSLENFAQVMRVGAGEVFVLFGHSFIQGGHDESHQFPASDERVCSLQDRLGDVQYQFGKLVKDIGPFHGSPDSWSLLGDMLVQAYDVPVLFYGSGYGGSNLQMSLDVIDNVPLTQLPPGYAGIESRQPFAPLETVFDNYIKKTGVRAVLFEHGYNDRGKTKDQYLAMLNRFVKVVRDRWSIPALPFVVVQEQLSAVPNTLYDIPTAQAQQAFIAAGNNVYAGPDFNKPAWNGLFAQHDHLFGAALDQFATDWKNALANGFIESTLPYMPYPDLGGSNLLTGQLYRAGGPITVIDWAVLGMAALCLVGIFVYKSKYLIWAFIILGLLAMARLNGKL